MSQTLGQNFQDVQESALSVLNRPARTSNEDVMSAIDAQLNVPLRIYATTPVANAVLNIEPNQILLGDGSTQSTPPLEDTIQSYLGATIDFQTGAVGGSGSVTTQGAAFAIPASTIGQFRRVALVYNSFDNLIDTIFSAESVTEGGLTNPGVLFSILGNTPIGYLDIEATGATAFKTAGSATSIIENAKIYRFGSGVGGGSGGDTSFKIQSVSDPVATIKGGYLIDNGGREYATFNGGFYGLNITVDLDTIFGGDPVDATTYYLYIDRDSLGAAATEAETGRKLFQITEAELALLTDTPDLVDLTRYIPLGLIRSASAGTVWSGAGSEFRDLARRNHIGADLLRYEQEFTVTPGATLPHGLGERPDYIAVLHNELADGRFAVLDASSYIKTDDTNLYTNGFGALTIDGTHELRIVAFKTQRAASFDLSNLNNFKPSYTSYNSGPQTAGDAEHIITDTTSGPFTIDLPPSPVFGTRVVVYDGALTWDSDNLTIGRNGENINGVADDALLDSVVVGKKVEFIFIGGAAGWRTYISG